MKKYVLFSVIIIVLVLAGWYFLTKKNNSGTKKTTIESVKEVLSDKYNKPANAVTVEVSVDTGKFAKGSVKFEGEMGGGLWFAAKTAQGWELAFDGNGIVPCDAANKYNFPKDIIPQCINAQNGNELIQR